MYPYCFDHEFGAGIKERYIPISFPEHARSRVSGYIRARNMK